MIAETSGLDTAHLPTMEVGAASTQPGVIGFSRDYDAVQGFTFGGTGVIGIPIAGVGVVGSSNNIGVYGETTNPDPAAYAGVFDGNLLVTGRIQAGIKDAIVPKTISPVCHFLAPRLAASAHSITSSARKQRGREGEAERLSGTSAGKQLDTGRRLRPAGRP
jgi:hypothetical protein